ncbi:hypothetical protein Goshw_010643 [Gossypium schwendimanii]|uniref:Uncharacterized protein n=1 Tax=Gossypium schwendimanii TaxID=34291 RepID=A0A7J9N1Y0_GOSSC|nr:hypothetical protein [Gossypium schwendimanii]
MTRNNILRLKLPGLLKN